MKPISLLFLMTMTLQVYAVSPVEWTDPYTGSRFISIGKYSRWNAGEACEKHGPYWVLPTTSDIGDELADRISRSPEIGPTLLVKNRAAKVFWLANYYVFNYCFIYHSSPSKKMHLESRIQTAIYPVICINKPF